MQATKPTHVRYLILLMLFLVTTINYADRATIAIAGSSLQKDLGIDAVSAAKISMGVSLILAILAKSNCPKSPCQPWASNRHRSRREWRGHPGRCRTS